LKRCEINTGTHQPKTDTNADGTPDAAVTTYDATGLITTYNNAGGGGNAISSGNAAING